MELIRYLEAHYLSEEQLLSASGLTPPSWQTCRRAS